MCPFRRGSLSCVNARSRICTKPRKWCAERGGRVATGVEFLSRRGERRSAGPGPRSNGLTGTLWWTPALFRCHRCGTCIGLGRGLVGKGEIAISATTRNFKGRMGDPDAQVYLGSPAVVAASALAGFICAPQTFTDRAAGTAIRRAQSKPPSAVSVEIIAGFPPSVRGRVLFVDKDNLNTDGIYAGKHTYRDDLTPEEMAAGL